MLSDGDTLWSLRFGNFDGAWHTSGCDFMGTQSGGSVLVRGDRLGLGSIMQNVTATYDLSGGEIRILNANTDNALQIASGTNDNSLSHFTLRGSGKLVTRYEIEGYRPEEGANQVFSFLGGTLAAAAFNAANLRSEPGGTRGTLVNAGGVIAPGDNGIPGRTSLYGNYTSAPQATLAFDLGGVSQATAFTNPPGYYDCLQISGTAAIDGALRVALIDSFQPGGADTFTVLSAGSALTFPSGGFSTVNHGQLWDDAGTTRFDVGLSADGKSVILGSAVLNQWTGATGGDWDDDGAWSVTNPATAAFGACFGRALTADGTVNMATPRTLRGLTFDNATAAYTLAGSGGITLTADGAPGMPHLRVLSGRHTVAVGLTLQDALTVTVGAPADMLTLAGGISGAQNLYKRGGGTLALAGNNTLGALVLEEGTILQQAGETTCHTLSLADGVSYRLMAWRLTLLNGLEIAEGAAFDFNSYGGGTLRLVRGESGGPIDTLPEFWAAVADQRITIKGGPVMEPSLFIISEEVVNAEPILVITLKSFGTVIQFK